MLAFSFDRDDAVSVCAVCILSLAATTSFSAERKNPVAYSKFASEELNADAPSSMMLPSRWGMLIIYFPAAIVGTWIVLSNWLNNHEVAEDSPLWLRPASALLTIHFWKRVLEVLFVHVYSGSMAAESGVIISVAYATYTWLIASREVGWDEHGSSRMQVLYGVALFLLATMGNFYHHLLLASLRTAKSSGNVKRAGSSSSKYQLPSGGLFDFVVAPHYLFELLAWLGIALVAQTVIALLVMATMTAYLSARSLNTRDFYQRRFQKAWPEQRRALIPFFF